MALTCTLVADSAVVLHIVWWGWSLLLLRFTWKLASWPVDYLVITSSRVLSIRGLVRRRVSVMALVAMTDMRFLYSVPGRIFGYGKYIPKPAGQGPALRTIDYVPYPDAIYQEIMAMLYPDKSGDQVED